VIGVGSPGSSTEILAFRVLRAAGLDPARDVRTQNLGVGPMAEALRDGKIDALIWIGGVPTAAILDLASTPGRSLVLVPCAEVLATMQRTHGAAIYVPQTIAAGGYAGITTDVPVIGLANLLVADARMSDELAHEITRALFEHAPEIAAVHAEARHLRVESAVLGSPIAYHPGAVQYYTERDVWKS
jgi:TRAP transporter TAXI family solute receptor